jgi:hypothetical protein
MLSCVSPAQKMRAVDATRLHDAHQLLRKYSTNFFALLEASTPFRVLPAAKSFYYQWLYGSAAKRSGVAEIAWSMHSEKYIPQQVI